MAAEVVKLADSAAVVKEAANRWIEIARQAVADRETFSVALSGGRTPQPLFELLTADEYREQLPWHQTHIFWGDERRVPASDPRSNYGMAYDSLLRHVPIPEKQIHRMEGGGLASSAARDYENELWRYFRFDRHEWPRFDLCLLGMGSDGHVASIFPGTRAVSDLSNKVIVYEIPRLSEERMTLTVPVFNNARNVVVLITGSEKADALNATLNGPRQPSTYPGQTLNLKDGKLVWLVDYAAAGRLK